MSVKEQINQDLKTAMLAGDKTLTVTLQGLKSVILDAEIEKAARDKGLPDEEVIQVLQKEVKRRQESADMYKDGGNTQNAEAELAEKSAIEKYLPKQITDSELQAIVDEVIASTEAKDVKDMGRVIKAVKDRVGVSADGGRIAKVVKGKLNT
ncbi:MAG: GatB/YqeY domain-containing protein [Candidatus Saccharibacteria bacterium]|nr:GatB/YqeY domain-containing protein [Candidatus Saccharibacteria bacterium]